MDWINNVQFFTYVGVILSSIGTTLALSLASFSIATIVALLLSFIEIFGPRPLVKAVEWYVKIVRGIPLILALFMFYYGLPRVGFPLPPLYSAIMGIALVDSAYQEQLFKGAIEGVSERQVEAAYAIGLTQWEVFRHVILPQAFRIALPGWINEFSMVLKDSSIAYAIGVTEIFTQAVHVAHVIADYLRPLLIVSLIYLCICYPLSQISSRFHKGLVEMGMMGS
ncbi:MAG: amino acid ABC transporter permease [Ignisphaera sp.]|nr:amino acid ABC transporter permease [Ignisphaera sp.]MCX8167455.1 amino acid ABC transporter permease [Ignisphaera sp.]MDW8084681.1 amino acid ABC transporter permease [Ignisphaera sp.]